MLGINGASRAVGFLPVGLGPDRRRGVLFPVVIVEITSEELHQILSGRLSLPRGWQISEELKPKVAVVEGAA